ncbi:MAG: uroporphyrinogen decarboxylase [Alphaproteobacteria bacterium]|nr:uroporphyrinogen decarboxylase [Alphaproteobacteria bacterium]
MKPLLAALRGERSARVPFWYMRQAGRYLPEYRQVRARAGGFLDLCFNPDLATEVTLQPVRRFGMDAAILFSDILVIPFGLGMGVRFEEGEGPKLDRLETLDRLPTLETDEFKTKLDPVYEAVSLIASRLEPETTLIGFAGAPWTVATYMVEGGSSRDFARTKAWAYGNPKGFERLIDVIVNATIEHLSAQISAGAEVVQLFDSWAGVLSDQQFERWSTRPIRAIVDAVKHRHPTIPIIAFPRGAGANYVNAAKHAGADAIGLDTTVPVEWAAIELQPTCVVQGNLDPLLVVLGGAAMLADAERILRGLNNGPLIFNLGHGVVPETPPENVDALSQFIRDFRRD